MNLPDTRILVRQYLQVMRMNNCTDRTISERRYLLQRFVNWCDQRGVDSMDGVTVDHVRAYRRSLFYYRNPKTGLPLKFETQGAYLKPVRRWFQWMCELGYLEVDPTEGVDAPKAEERLPIDVLTAEQVEAVLNQPDVDTPIGVRDRAMLETFYSTAIRSTELANLDVYDVSVDRRLISIRQGKGKKDRVVPVGQRALLWIDKWQQDARPALIDRTSSQALFVSFRGRRLKQNFLSSQVRKYLDAAGIRQRGACHLFRHTAATLMMENGADLRSLQMMLGHKRLNTTQLYTHVSLVRLREVHERTHPARPHQKSDEDGNQ